MWGAKKSETGVCFVLWYNNIYIKFYLSFLKQFALATLEHVDQHSSQYKTHYGLDGPVMESQWGRDFVYPSRTALPDNYGYWGFPGFKVAGHSVDHPPPCNAEVEFFTYNLPVVPAWTVLEWTSPLPLTLQFCIQRCIKYCDVCLDCTGRLNFCYLLLTNLCSRLSGISSVSLKACTLHQEPRKPGKSRRSRSQRWVIFAYIVIIILNVRPPPPKKRRHFDVGNSLWRFWWVCDDRLKALAKLLACLWWRHLCLVLTEGKRQN